MVLVEHSSCYSCIFYSQHNLQAHECINQQVAVQDGISAVVWMFNRRVTLKVHSSIIFANCYLTGFSTHPNHQISMTSIKKGGINGSRSICIPPRDLTHCFSLHFTGTNVGPLLLKGFSQKVRVPLLGI